MQKIVPNLWCDGNAQEIADFYVSVFPKSRITGGSTYPESTEEGLADFQLELAGKPLTVELNLAGHDFVLINAGPEFKPTPSTSFMVNFDPSHDPDAKKHLDETWEKLLDGGEALMPLQKYDFSEHYGWVKDKFGFNWQLILMDYSDERGCIVPAMMFGGPVQNKASEAIDYYAEVFKNAKKGEQYHYEEQTGPATTESLMYADLILENQWFALNDSGVEQDFTFNESVSFSISCKDQEEIDYYWEKLSKVPESEQCGWCKDQFGVSWQIVPENMEELMSKPDAFKIMMNQHKIVIAEY